MIEPGEALPDGWGWRTVGELVVDARPGFASGEKSVESGVPQLRKNNLGGDGKLNLELVRQVPRALASARYHLQTGDVVFCQTNSPKLVGKTVVFDLDEEFVFSNHLCRLRPRSEAVDERWLARWLHALWGSGYFAERCKSWVNQATVGRAVLLATPVPTPCLPEQRLILAALDATLGRLDAARARLARVPEICKRYRASLLKAACEGRLVPTEAELARREDRHYEPADVLLARMLDERRAK